jgi:N6-L-threonylcarbamoyladenine synthase
MYVLGIDTSNYATSLALVCTQAKEVVCDKKQFLPVKPGQLGLRQSEAVFHHTAALPQLLQQLNDVVPWRKWAPWVSASARELWTARICRAFWPE